MKSIFDISTDLFLEPDITECVSLWNSPGKRKERI
jgi:hypothetical protein